MEKVLISQNQNSRTYVVKINENMVQIIEEFWQPGSSFCTFFNSKIILREEYEALKKLFEGDKNERSYYK